MKYEHYEVLEALLKRAEISETPWDILEEQYNEGWITSESFFISKYRNFKYRIKQERIKIGKKEVTAPLKRSDIKEGQIYYYPLFGTESKYGFSRIGNNVIEDYIFSNGFARRTASDAIELYDAIIDVMKSE